MLGVERDLNGWKAHALELWVKSRERVADDLCVRADCFARLGFVAQAKRDRYVAGRLRHRAAIDRVEAAELWRYHSLIFVHRREVTVVSCAPMPPRSHQWKPQQSRPRASTSRSKRQREVAGIWQFGARTCGHPNSTCFRRSGCLSRPM